MNDVFLTAREMRLDGRLVVVRVVMVSFHIFPSHCQQIAVLLGWIGGHHAKAVLDRFPACRGNVTVVARQSSRAGNRGAV